MSAGSPSDLNCKGQRPSPSVRECAGSVPNVVNGKFATLSLITNRIVNRGYFVSYNFDLREYLLRRAVGDDAPVVDLDDARGEVGDRPRKLGTDPERYPGERHEIPRGKWCLDPGVSGAFTRGFRVLLPRGIWCLDPGVFGV